MAAEVYALVEAFDAAYVIASDLQAIHNTVVPIDLFTDSKQVFDAVTKDRKTAKKRLMIDILATREAYRRFEIRGIGIVSGEDSPADGLSKAKDNGMFQRLVLLNEDKTQVLQWVDRSCLHASTDSTEREVWYVKCKKHSTHGFLKRLIYSSQNYHWVGVD